MKNIFNYDKKSKRINFYYKSHNYNSLNSEIKSCNPELKLR